MGNLVFGRYLFDFYNSNAHKILHRKKIECTFSIILGNFCHSCQKLPSQKWKTIIKPHFSFLEVLTILAVFEHIRFLSVVWVFQNEVFQRNFPFCFLMLFWALCFSSKKTRFVSFFLKKAKKKAWEKPSLNAAVGGECGRRRQPRQVAHVHRLDEAHLVDLHQRSHERRVRPGSCWVPLLQRTEKTLKMFF